VADRFGRRDWVNASVKVYNALALLRAEGRKEMLLLIPLPVKKRSTGAEHRRALRAGVRGTRGQLAGR
jgi:hypothetical protein